MKFFEDEAQLLVSEALKDNLSNVDVSVYADRFIIVELSVGVGEEVEKVNATLFSCEFSSAGVNLEAKVVFEDAFGLSEAWSNVVIKEFSFFLGEEVIVHEGPFSIGSFGIKNMTPEQRMCVISLSMNRE